MKSLKTSRNTRIVRCLILFVLSAVTAFPTTNFHADGRWTKNNHQRRQCRFSPLAAAAESRLQHSESDLRYNSHSLPPISDRNVELNMTEALVYDPDSDHFVRASTSQGLAALYSINQSSESLSTRIKRTIRHSFVPQGVPQSYFHFMKWRILQRFINAILHVLGTQSLIMGLGIKSAKSLGISAALTWVSKDALGKLTRLVWASRMSRRFDSDAKRWRFRASLVYALGNCLEIVTYINPGLFLLWATLANSCKQVAMLTSSATRTSLFNSFRDGKRENIADITAKGEAQIAIVDLLGIGFALSLSQLIGTSIKRILTLYLFLQFTEIFCLFRQIHGIEFNILNFERMMRVIDSFCDGVDCVDYGNDIGKGINTTTSMTTTSITQERDNHSDIRIIPTPKQMARKERIFLPPQHLRRRTLVFGSLGRAKLNPEELLQLMKLFSNERYILVIGENTKNPHKRRGIFQKSSFEEKVQQNCHVVLHEEASNLDVVKSTLALSILRRKLLTVAKEEMYHTTKLRSSDCWDLLEEVRDKTDQMFPLLLRQLSLQKWSSPSRSMFGRVSRRASWPMGFKDKKTP